MTGVPWTNKTIPAELVDGLVNAWKTKSFDAIKSELQKIFMQGYSGLQLLNQLHQEIVQGSKFNKTEKAKIAVSIGRVEKKLFDGADEELQLLQLLCVQ